MSYYELTDIKGVGEKRAQLFCKLGVSDINALLYYYPKSYTDLSSPVSPADAPYGVPCAVMAEVVSPVVESRIRKGMTVYKFVASNDGAALKITLFNQKFLAQKIKTGQSYIFYGKISGNIYNREMASPEITDSDKAYIRPAYHATEGLPSYQIEKAVASVIESGYCPEDPIPADIRTKYRLMPLKEALHNIHFPVSEDKLNSARRRLMFQELLLLQCGINFMRMNASERTSLPIEDHSEEFERMLPFELTGAQRKSIRESIADMSGGKPMNRLLQGDVGSGKTAVAASLCYSTVKSGYQAAIMAPTEILAAQHYSSMYGLFKDSGISVALLTASTKNKKELYEQIATGKIDLVIGTHALIQEEVVFNDLQLVVTDEQHRFGVNQRNLLINKGSSANVLVMSATPIPRTLALIIYGDLDISVLDELPPGRQPVQTRHITSEKREKAFEFLIGQLNKGRQAYIVCPLVEENDTDLTPATEYCEQLKNGYFKGYNVGLLHGRMKQQEKDRVMQDFASGKCNVLVSTTVIEVGVDVPNSTVMMIENAERFGLSQLHQLRGRVGRGKYKSFCILISDAQNDVAVGRFNIMCETADGFRIAEYDLKTRGPGDFFGSRQHGLPALKLADFISDYKAVSFAQDIAKQISAEDPMLKMQSHSELKKAIIGLFEQTGGTIN